jgi:hypothetical protein
VVAFAVGICGGVFSLAATAVLVNAHARNADWLWYLYFFVRVGDAEQVILVMLLPCVVTWIIGIPAILKIKESRDDRGAIGLAVMAFVQSLVWPLFDFMYIVGHVPPA